MTRKRRESGIEGHTRILIPLGEKVNRERITQALHILSVFKSPLVVLFQVVEVPSRTGTLEPELYKDAIKNAEVRLRELSKWLSDQGIRVLTKVALARNAAEGIIAETENESYVIVFLMKRKTEKGWKRLFSHSVSQEVVRNANCFVMTAPIDQTALSRQ
jgi:nucleotide-binding universal stress UspA family protein